MKLTGIDRRLVWALGTCFVFSGIADGHFGIVDGYGCHQNREKGGYHCHQGEFAGRTFKSKEDFLRQLRGGKSESLSPKNNLPPLERKADP